MKVYRDGDTELPTICGTGLEDYVGSAWGMGAHHAAPYGGAPLIVAPATAGAAQPRLRRLLPLAPARPDHVRARPAGDDPADRRHVLPGRARRPSSRRTSATNPVAGEGWIAQPRARACWRGASPSGSTTTARPPSSTAPSRSRCPASTSPPRSPTSSGATTSRSRPASGWRKWSTRPSRELSRPSCPSSRRWTSTSSTRSPSRSRTCVTHHEHWRESLFFIAHPPDGLGDVRHPDAGPLPEARA